MPFVKENTLIDLIQDAVHKKEKIIIYGDYDVDGLTSTVILQDALEVIGARTEIYIPNRTKEGYGVNLQAVDLLAEKQASVLITVDCGIRALEEIKHAKQLGLKTIITDHHRPGPELPPADAIINPHLKESSLDPNLAGVGVVWMIVSRLADEYKQIHPEGYLDLAALGTVADIVPLRGFNRSLVRHGISRLRTSHRQGLYSLIRIAGLERTRISSADISFQLAPRLNAASRIADATLALDLLRSTRPEESGLLAQRLELLNNQRRQLTRQVVDAVEAHLEDSAGKIPALITWDPLYHPGILGIAAGKLSRKYHRPVLIGHQRDPATTFSSRSIPEFNIIEALEDCRDLLLDYGGHNQAAGFSILNDNLEDFRGRMTELAEKQLQDLTLQPVLTADARIRMDQLDEELLSCLELLEPTGEGNPRPIFFLEDVSLTSVKKVGADQNHLKCTVLQDGVSMPGIGFGLGDYQTTLESSADLLVHFEENYFRGKVTPQVQILAIRNS